jgi:hypothetical protein
MKELNQSEAIFFSEEFSNLIISNLILLASQSFITLRLSSKGKRGVDERIFNFTLHTTC